MALLALLCSLRASTDNMLFSCGAVTERGSLPWDSSFVPPTAVAVRKGYSGFLMFPMDHGDAPIRTRCCLVFFVPLLPFSCESHSLRFSPPPSLTFVICTSSFYTSISRCLWRRRLRVPRFAAGAVPMAVPLPVYLPAGYTASEAAPAVSEFNMMDNECNRCSAQVCFCLHRKHTPMFPFPALTRARLSRMYVLCICVAPLLQLLRLGSTGALFHRPRLQRWFALTKRQLAAAQAQPLYSSDEQAFVHVLLQVQSVYMCAQRTFSHCIAPCVTAPQTPGLLSVVVFSDTLLAVEVCCRS